MMVIFFNVVNHMLFPRSVALTGKVGYYHYVTQLAKINYRSYYSI